jgi:hypothetical protein
LFGNNEAILLFENTFLVKPFRECGKVLTSREAGKEKTKGGVDLLTQKNKYNPGKKIRSANHH